MKNRAELGFALGWVAFGTAVLAGSWRMDRLESLHINPWSAPGLMPGVLGVLMMVFGAFLSFRSLAREELAQAKGQTSSSRIRLALALCVGYAAGLLGHGLPFWLTSAAFMFVAIFAFRWLDRDAQARPGLTRLALSSATIALSAAVVIGLVFEQLFLVRLP